MIPSEEYTVSGILKALTAGLEHHCRTFGILPNSCEYNVAAAIAMHLFLRGLASTEKELIAALEAEHIRTVT